MKQADRTSHRAECRSPKSDLKSKYQKAGSSRAAPRGIGGAARCRTQREDFLEVKLHRLRAMPCCLENRQAGARRTGHCRTVPRQSRQMVRYSRNIVAGAIVGHPPRQRRPQWNQARDSHRPAARVCKARLSCMACSLRHGTTRWLPVLFSAGL